MSVSTAPTFVCETCRSECNLNGTSVHEHRTFTQVWALFDDERINERGSTLIGFIPDDSLPNRLYSTADRAADGGYSPVLVSITGEKVSTELMRELLRPTPTPPALTLDSRSDTTEWLDDTWSCDRYEPVL